MGNRFLSLFGSDIEDRLRDELLDAEYRLNDNYSDQRSAQNSVESYSRLSNLAKNVGSVFLDHKNQLIVGFNEEFTRVTNAQKVETGMWQGLIELKNHVWATHYVSTCEKSLQQILKLLCADDTVFMSGDLYEAADLRIKVDIRQKLGDQRP